MTEANHSKLSQYLVSRSSFEQSTSRIQVRSATAWTKNLLSLNEAVILGCNRKMGTQFVYEFNIPTQEEMPTSTCFLRTFKLCLYLKEYSNEKCSKIPSWNSMHASTRLIVDRRVRSKVQGQWRVVWQTSTMRWWNSSSMSTGAAYTRDFRCPHS